MADELKSAPPVASPGALWAFGMAALALGGTVFYGFWRRGTEPKAALTIVGRTGAPEGAPIILADPKPVSANSLLGERDKPIPPPSSVVVVHIAGAVKRPGVYRFNPETRLVDAVAKAGGAAANADLDSINLAERVEDGKQIFVPMKQTSAASPSAVAAPAARPASGSSISTGKSIEAGKFNRPGKEGLNLNTANAEQLQRLPGVGPAMAERILTHRKENGPFTDPEQLMDVSGIGEKKFAKMRPFVKVR